jgi:hypothetical protein
MGRHWGKLMPFWTGFRGMIWGKNHSINGLVEGPLQWIFFVRILSLSCPAAYSVEVPGQASARLGNADIAEFICFRHFSAQRICTPKSLHPPSTGSPSRDLSLRPFIRSDSGITLFIFSSQTSVLMPKRTLYCPSRARSFQQGYSKLGTRGLMSEAAERGHERRLKIFPMFSSINQYPAP